MDMCPVFSEVLQFRFPMEYCAVSKELLSQLFVFTFTVSFMSVITGKGAGSWVSDVRIQNLGGNFGNLGTLPGAKVVRWVKKCKYLGSGGGCSECRWVVVVAVPDVHPKKGPVLSRALRQCFGDPLELPSFKGFDGFIRCKLS